MQVIGIRVKAGIVLTEVTTEFPPLPGDPKTRRENSNDSRNDYDAV